LKITFLGTGTSQGVPVITCGCDICQSVDYRDKRLRTSVYIETEGLSAVIDTGPDFRQQMLTNRIRQLDAVLFTHAHKDHTAGLDDIRSFNFKQKADMPVYGQKEVLAQLKTEFPYIFSKTKYPGVPSINLNAIENKPFPIGSQQILPIEVMHHKLPVFGYRLDGFAYITDAKTIADKEKKKLQNLDILVLNALQAEPHISHLTLDEAVGLAAELKAKKTYLTHISHKLGLHTEVAENLPENVFLAYDGLVLEC